MIKSTSPNRAEGAGRKRLEFPLWLRQPFVFVAVTFGPMPPPDEPTMPHEGIFDEEQNRLAETLYKAAHDRRVVIEAKATRLFSLVSLLTTFSASIILYSLSQAGIESSQRSAISAIGIATIVLTVCAFVASFRATRVGNVQSIWLSALMKDGKILKSYPAFTNDLRARGYLWCGQVNESTNNRVADFVRAGEFFIMGSVLVLIAGAIVVLASYEQPVTHPTEFVGTVEVKDRASPTAADVTSGLKAISNEIGRVADEVRGSTVNQRIVVLEQRVDAIVLELKAIRLLLDPATNPQPSPPATNPPSQP